MAVIAGLKDSDWPSGTMAKEPLNSWMQRTPEKQGAGATGGAAADAVPMPTVLATARAAATAPARQTRLLSPYIIFPPVKALI